MNNVHAVVLRTASLCSRPSLCPAPITILSRALGLSRTRDSRGNTHTIRTAPEPKTPHTHYHRISCHVFAGLVQARAFHSSQPQRFLRPSRSATQKIEQGLAFRNTPLSEAELRRVFGEVIPPHNFSNRLLRVLHGRRIDGTLDLSLPSDMEKILRRYPYAMDSALHWLRTNYYVDEDGAIMKRIEREEIEGETESPSDLMQRGQNVGLYGTQSQMKQSDTRGVAEPAQEETYLGPQSGNYQARLSEKEDDVFGQSQLEKIQAANKAKTAQEEEELEKQIAQIQEREVERRSQDTALASRPEQSIEAAQTEIRPPNSFERYVLRAKNQSTSKLTLDSPEIKNKTKAGRLLPSLMFVLSGCAGLYMFAQFWGPPDRSDRLWPNLTLSFATVAGILTANVAVWFLWRVPFAWPILNRYFIVVPATIKPLSLLGNIFSHMSLKHMAINAVPLIVFGPGLHEEMGRGNFLALYIASGLLGSYASMTRYVSQGILNTSSLGASGCTWAITAAFLNIHAE